MLMLPLHVSMMKGWKQCDEKRTKCGCGDEKLSFRNSSDRSGNAYVVVKRATMMMAPNSAAVRAMPAVVSPLLT